MIVIVDYGMGNLGSVLKSIKKINSDVIISRSGEDILKAKKLVLPGVGNFSKGMENLNELNYIDILNDRVLKDKIPILGICLGMQLFASCSEEGGSLGLSWLDATVVRFHITDKMKWKVPHIGWNSIQIIKKNDSLLNGINNNDLFYFVHSYHMKCNDKLDILTSTNYDNTFVSSVSKGNICGTQFHPEKSHDNGFNIIKNFISI